MYQRPPCLPPQPQVREKTLGRRRTACQKKEQRKAEAGQTSPKIKTVNHKYPAARVSSYGTILSNLNPHPVRCSYLLYTPHAKRCRYFRFHSFCFVSFRNIFSSGGGTWRALTPLARFRCRDPWRRCRQECRETPYPRVGVIHHGGGGLSGDYISKESSSGLAGTSGLVIVLSWSFARRVAAGERVWPASLLSERTAAV